MVSREINPNGQRRLRIGRGGLSNGYMGRAATVQKTGKLMTEPGVLKTRKMAAGGVWIDVYKVLGDRGSNEAGLYNYLDNKS